MNIYQNTTNFLVKIRSGEFSIVIQRDCSMINNISIMPASVHYTLIVLLIELKFMKEITTLAKLFS